MMRAMLKILTVLEFLAGVLFVTMGFMNESAAKTVWHQVAATTQILTGAVFLVGFGITVAVLALSDTLLVALTAKRKAAAEQNAEQW